MKGLKVLNAMDLGSYIENESDIWELNGNGGIVFIDNTNQTLMFKDGLCEEVFKFSDMNIITHGINYGGNEEITIIMYNKEKDYIETIILRQ